MMSAIAMCRTLLVGVCHQSIFYYLLDHISYLYEILNFAGHRYKTFITLILLRNGIYPHILSFRRYACRRG